MSLHDKTRRWLAFCIPVKSIITSHFRGQLVALTVIQVNAATLHMGELRDVWPAWILTKQCSEERWYGTRKHNTRTEMDKINEEASELDELKGSSSSSDLTLSVWMIQSSTVLEYYFGLTNERWTRAIVSISTASHFFQTSPLRYAP